MLLLIEYIWALLILIILEGILTIDNAIVFAFLMKKLPENQRKKELFYGLTGALIFRFIALCMISLLLDLWQVQALGSLYLLYIATKNLFEKENQQATKGKHIKKQEDFWRILLKVELIDLAFAIDSIFVAVALTMNLPKTNLGTIGELDIGQFSLVLIGGMIGLIIMRFSTSAFEKIIKSRPKLNITVSLVIGWVGIKLAVYALAHSPLSMIAHSFPESTTWKTLFWTIFIGIVISGWISSIRDRTSISD
ncbi:MULTISPECIES: TerC family protein [Bacillus]|uniref:TerC family protein n=1 Tax=Bacillus cereus TaxID=1396 RepID=A0A9X6GFQ7_BACCE|nr:hypothetical protein [Bacillus cereus]OOR74147.1 hypothetical protein BLX06_15555 [Bacillus cereus]